MEAIFLNFGNNFNLTNVFCIFIGTESDIQNRIHFEVDHDLYKGFLLAPHQIRATSKKRVKVLEIEAIFKKWMKQMEVAVIQSWLAIK